MSKGIDIRFFVLFHNFQFQCIQRDKRLLSVADDLNDHRQIIIGVEQVYLVNFKDKLFIKKCEQSIKYLYDLQDWSDFDRKLFQNKFDNLTPIEDRNTRILAEYFSIADQIAMKYQTITRKMFFRYSLVYSLLSIIVFYLSFYNWG